MTSKKDKAEVANDVVTEREELNLSLNKFWLEIDSVVRSSPSGSMLRDMARVVISLKSHSLPSNETEKVRSEHCQPLEW